MGLDIGYYSGIEFIEGDKPVDFDSGGFYVIAAPGYKDRLDSLREGSYSSLDSGSFRAGSYDSYNQWRDKLSRLGMGVPAEHVWNNRKVYQGKPFYELVDMSDCDGCIGPATSTKLLKDFRDFKEGAGMLGAEFYESYLDWLTAFETASQNGAVVFR